MTQQYPAPPAPAKKSGKKWLYIVLGIAVFVIIIVAASSNGSKGTTDASAATTPSAADAKPAHPATPKDTGKSDDKPAQSPAEEFKAFVGKNGAPAEQTAVKHVTKVQGADDKNDVLDTADIYTDYSGGLGSDATSSGKLIASAFADWQASRGKDSKNGLVTVYNASGDLLSTGKY